MSITCQHCLQDTEPRNYRCEFCGKPVSKAADEIIAKQQFKKVILKKAQEERIKL